MCTFKVMAAHLKAQRKSWDATVRGAVQHVSLAGSSRSVGPCGMLWAQLPFRVSGSCPGACPMLRQ